MARLEPVHELIRSIGPNLVIALLMDGPQVEGRWPGRYAMGLADDPGSSVLTLTSFGLVSRAFARAKKEFQSNSIGLWRDDRGETIEISSNKDTAAVLLSLSGERVEERTLDGRVGVNNAVRWLYVDQIPIPMPADSEFAIIS